MRKLKLAFFAAIAIGLMIGLGTVVFGGLSASPSLSAFSNMKPFVRSFLGVNEEPYVVAYTFEIIQIGIFVLLSGAMAIIIAIVAFFPIRMKFLLIIFANFLVVDIAFTVTGLAMAYGKSNLDRNYFISKSMSLIKKYDEKASVLKEVQTSLRCCGVVDYKDYASESKLWKDTLPKECCAGSGSICSVNSSNVITTGCLKRTFQLYKKMGSANSLATFLMAVPFITAFPEIAMMLRGKF